jgi:membrane protease YdiL (CAAX protease family)
VLGVISFAALVAWHVAAGGLVATPQPPAAWPAALTFALLTGLLVAAIEETIFRGWLLAGLHAASTIVPAVLLSSLLYSLAHYVTAVVRVRPGWDPLIGLRALALHLAAPARLEIALPCLALAAIGAVLACAYLWSGSLPFAIGLHAGWVAVMKAAPLALTPAIGSEWLYGPGGALAGVGGWLLIALMLAVLRLGLRQARS